MQKKLHNGRLLTNDGRIACLCCPGDPPCDCRAPFQPSGYTWPPESGQVTFQPNPDWSQAHSNLAFGHKLIFQGLVGSPSGSVNPNEWVEVHIGLWRFRFIWINIFSIHIQVYQDAALIYDYPNLSHFGNTFSYKVESCYSADLGYARVSFSAGTGGFSRTITCRGDVTSRFGGDSNIVGDFGSTGDISISSFWNKPGDSCCPPCMTACHDMLCSQGTSTWDSVICTLTMAGWYSTKPVECPVCTELNSTFQKPVVEAPDGTLSCEFKYNTPWNGDSNSCSYKNAWINGWYANVAFVPFQQGVGLPVSGFRMNFLAYAPDSAIEQISYSQDFQGQLDCAGFSHTFNAPPFDVQPGEFNWLNSCSYDGSNITVSLSGAVAMGSAGAMRAPHPFLPIETEWRRGRDGIMKPVRPKGVRLTRK